MKIRTVLIILICTTTCFMLSGCRAKDVSRLIRVGSKLIDKFDGSSDEQDGTSNEEEVVSLSDNDKRILANLLDSSIIYNNSGVTEFVSSIVKQDDVFNFDKNQKSEYCMEAINPELAVDIAYDALGIIFNKEDFDLNQYGNIDIFAAGGEDTAFYINKAVKTSEDEYSIYANSVFSPGEGVDLSGCYILNVRKNNQSMFGYTIIDFNYCTEVEWVPEKISASSTLNSSGSNSYDTKNLIDRNAATAWAEGSDGTGIGECVLFESSKRQRVSGVFINNGYLKSTDLLNKNGAVKRVRFEFSDGSSVESNLNTVLTTDNYSDLGCLYTDYINFGKEIETTFIKMTILDASAGRTYEDTCISEIKFIK